YSLAVVIHEMLTGRPPFDGLDHAQLATAVFTAAPRLLSALRTDLPNWLGTAVGRALAKQPGDRSPSMTAFAAALHGGATDTATAGRVSARASVGCALES